MSNSPEDSGFFNKLFSKLTPRTLVFLLETALFLLTVVILFAISKGNMVELGEMRIGSAEQLKSRSNGSRTYGFEAGHASVLTPANLLKMWGDKPSFVFNQLEIMIPEYEGSINTRKEIKDESRREVYKLIQISLEFIGYFNDPPNGDQKSTYFALKKFQEEFNAKVPEEEKLKHIGFFGRRTLAAIRRKRQDIIGWS